MRRINITWRQINELAKSMANKINKEFTPQEAICIYPIPRGGIYAAQAVIPYLEGRAYIAEEFDPTTIDIFVDDIIDSGATEQKWIEGALAYNTPISFYALVDKRDFMDEDVRGEWVSFPWERMTNDDGPEENIRRILEFIGEDPKREGLKETPNRVIRSYSELFEGYKKDPKDILKVFEEPCDEMVLVKNIEFYSTCEHHLLPFHGKAHVAYIPKGKVVGVSKLARLVEIFSRRAQIQERICQQVTEALMEIVEPLGAACLLEAQHMCMVCRGIKKQNSVMVTSSLKGVFLSKPEVRAEFMSMIK